ncbi:serine hydrolase [Cryobacterium sp. TMT3-29-2]|uniref:serine hydrolase domain-containing protein n=1 Tax=Cryobacterium sp. TMT3-29-2 TaxID=2555867 RepID=UPI0010748DA6|nr:serine hydrolase domain-containing protein [Cryobacterium sp. TMT3-29-2]TFC91558.1 class A beta-lactamase-related serine hydrolase [Cryobacterium sp. TMT3-29-2]
MGDAITKPNTRRRLLVALGVAAAMVLSGCTAGPERADPNDAPIAADIAGRLDSAVGEAMALSGSSGALVGVWSAAGNWTVAPGTTEIGGSAPMSSGMHFRIGTNTTAMTCTVLLRLVDKGKVSLDDLVSTYLPRMVGVTGITLGQLCQGTSGLETYSSVLAGEFVHNPLRTWPAMELIAQGLAAPRNGAPGTVWGPSNTGMVLLGTALERATGQEWSALYDEYIFHPLGLHDTSYPHAGDEDLPAPHAHGYAAQVGADGPVCTDIADITLLSNSMSGVAGGVVSTLADMRIWAGALAAGGLLSETSASAQWNTVTEDLEAPAWQSYGLGAEQVGPLRGRTGSIPGFISATLADPDQTLTVVVMLNNSSAGDQFALTLARQLAAIVAEAPAEGDTEPSVVLPWTVEQTRAELAADAACPTPAEIVG